MSRGGRRVRLPVLGALLLALSATVASSPGELGPYEVFNSMPGPYFVLSDNRTIVDWLVTVRAPQAAFPPEGEWTEMFEVELDVEEEGLDLDRRFVFGRLARVAPDGLTVLSSTVARVEASERGSFILTDEQGTSPCIDGICEKRYVARFVMSGFGFLRTQWFIRAGIDWENGELEVPEAADLALQVRLL